MSEETEVKPPEPAEIISGEIHLVIDAKTGAMKFSGPANKIVAYGMLELAKEIIRTQSARPAQPPAILKAGADTLKMLDRRPS